MSVQQSNETQSPGLGAWHHHQVHTKNELEKSCPTGSSALTQTSLGSLSPSTLCPLPRTGC